MTDSEIIKALECCAWCPPSCRECPYTLKECSSLRNHALALINRQKAEIERLQDYNENLLCINTDLSNNLLDEVKTARAEAVKEFAERLKEQRIKPEFPWDDFTVTEGMIDDLVKEFTEDKT